MIKQQSLMVSLPFTLELTLQTICCVTVFKSLSYHCSCYYCFFCSNSCNRGSYSGLCSGYGCCCYPFCYAAGCTTAAAAAAAATTSQCIPLMTFSHSPCCSLLQSNVMYLTVALISVVETSPSSQTWRWARSCEYYQGNINLDFSW